MNTVTKVFIFINFVLALGVMYVVPVNYAYQEHWKRRWDRDTRELKALTEQSAQRILDLSTEKTAADLALGSVRSELSQAQRTVADLTSERTNLERTNAQLRTDIDRQSAQLQARDQRINSQQERIDNLQVQADELNAIAHAARATAHTLNLKLAEVEDDLHNTQAELTRAERAIFKLEQENRRRSAYLALLRDHHPEIYAQITSDVPTTDEVIRAVVAAVRPNPQGQQDLVMLTVGATENVREGMEFIIYRDGDYIVKIRAERIFDDMVAGRVIPGTWNPRGDAIQQGDSATNKLF